MKYKQAYEFGVTKLQEHQILEANLDARILLEWICKTDRNALLAHGDREITSEQEEKYKEAIERRASHIPLQHITNEQEFMGLPFYVNENVLIPRQDTEILVEEAMLQIHDGMSILDICTGSGCILLSLLKYKNDCTGVGVDISEEALEVAKENAKRLEVQVEFLQSDLLENVTGKFDVVVSNPPYIRSDVIETLMEEVKEHEPYIALDGKEDGLYFYRRITEEVKKVLHSGGSLLFEIGYDQGKEVEELMKTAGFQEVKIVQDYAGLDRVVMGIYR